MSNNIPDCPASITLAPGSLRERYWSDLLSYRDLFWVLARRDIAVRYKQTVIGVLWAVLRPLATMLVFAFVFGQVARLPSGGLPYELMVFAGLIPWYLFATSVAESANSLVVNANLLSKVYFPRLIIPASSVLVALVDALISLVLLLILLAAYGVWPTWRLFCLPIFAGIAFASALGLGLFFSVLNARYRDFQHVVPFMLQFGLYVSPVGFMSAVVPENWRVVYGLNPLVAVIDGFRWSLLGEAYALSWGQLAASVLFAALLLLGGLMVFRRLERDLADVL